MALRLPACATAAFALAVTLGPAAPAQAPAAVHPGRPQSTAKSATSMTKTLFGHLPSGAAADLYTLSNVRGAQVAIATYGATVVSIRVPDRAGRLDDVVLGYDSLAGYLAGTYYYGATVGRYANRIANGKFTLDGRAYSLPINNGPNSLHGGLVGFDKVLWTATDASTPASPALRLAYRSRDGEQGYPGDLAVTVTFTLSADSRLRIDYAASTDRDTVLNLTNHCYFNLNGRGKGTILGHQLRIDAARFTPINANLIPTGELRPVAGTPFDFTRSTPLGARIALHDPQLGFGNGYDHNFVLNPDAADLAAPAAAAYDPATGRALSVYTTQPGLQLYTGNYLVPPHTGFALETQHFPDSPNHPAFPSTELKPGQTFRSTTIYAFSVK